jgi:murein DD-endopeptidase MepM/ murein hydrolase activator NlpD
MVSQIEIVGGNLRGVQGSSTAQDAARVREVSQEFESLFIAYLLKVMRETIEEASGAEGGFGKGIYTEMFDQELSRAVARGGGLGISDLICRSLSARSTAQPASNDFPEEKRGAPMKGAIPEQEISQIRGCDIPDSLLPVSAPVSSAFGMRRDPVTHHMRLHRGLDLAAPAGVKVAAPWSGRVVSAGFEAGYGNCVIVKHPEGFQTRYAHLGSVAVRAGDTVAVGQALGVVGSTGRSTGAHLHFEVIRNGTQVDPRGVLMD